MEKHMDFVAIDVETANKKMQICSIGIAVVKNGEVYLTKKWLVRPPENYYEKNFVRVHGVTSEMTECEKNFAEVWEDLSMYLIGQKIVAHNSKTEMEAFAKAFKDNPEIFPMGVSLNDIFCTMKIHNGKGLTATCQAYGIERENEHDPEYDALYCAEVYLRHLKGETPDWSLVAEGPKKKSQPKKRKGDIKSAEVNEMESVADENSPFYNRNIVVTGDFYIGGKEVDRSEIKIKLRTQYGAWLKDNVSGKIHFALIGENPGPKKMDDIERLAYNGFKIRKLYAEDLENIMNGEWKGYHVSEEIFKDLDLTYEHYSKKCISFTDGQNVIARKEVFIGKGLSGDKGLFSQMLGNLGAFGNYQMAPDINLCVLSDSTLEKLKNGERDDTVMYVQACYNSYKARTFELSFISEGEILRFVKESVEQKNYESTGYYYRRYLGEIERKD